MITNTTRKAIIARKKINCKNALSKAKGLMFTRKKKDTGMIFGFDNESKLTLHMFFVFYPIDVLFLNAKKIVVEIKKEFEPFTIYTTKQKIKYAIELPTGLIKETKKGDKIMF